jgi:phage portal protein BeeE
VAVTLFGRLFNRAETRDGVLANPAYPLTSSALIDMFSAPNTASGIRVGERGAERVTAIYRAWSLIAGTIGSLPLQCFRGEPPGGDRWTGDAASLLAFPGGRDPVTGIALPGTPTAIVFYETLVVHLLSWGNAYVVKIPAEVGGDRVVALDQRAPHQVEPRWVGRTVNNPSGKAFFITDPDTGEVMVATPRDVIHIRALGHDLLQGISPIGAARQALGLAKWQPIGIPPQDSQFIQSREFAITEIARLYGIPPHLLAQVDRATSWGSGIQEQGISFNIYTLRVWAARIEQTLSNELLPRGVNARFNVAELLRGDMKQEIDAHQVAILSGQETPNEARAGRGLPPVPGGDVLYFPTNYASMDKIAQAPAPAQIAAAAAANKPPPPTGSDAGSTNAQPAQAANPGGSTDAAGTQ